MASSCYSSNVTPTLVLDGIIALSAIHEMESKSDKDAWKDAIDCFKETKDRCELKMSHLTQLANENFDGFKELKVHSSIMDFCE
nr:hypothetical protein [Tanacetum cinerariifolium]